MNIDNRVAECPDADASWLSSIECDFAIPVYMTQQQQQRLHRLLHEIVSAPWNQPVDGCHWLAEWGAKPHWQEPLEPTFDDKVLHGASCARPFVSDVERQRKMADRAKPPKENVARDIVIEALEAVAKFWGSDPKAFGDEATVTSLAGRFSVVASKCRRAMAALKEAKAIEASL